MSSFVEADRGLGKSRLVDELRARHPEVLLLCLQGEPYGQGTPYLPFQRPLRELLGIGTDDPKLAASQLCALVEALGADVAPLAPLLGPVTGIELDDTPESAAIVAEFRRDRTADLLLRLYDALLDRTLLVFVEDAHWFDETTSGLAERLLAAASSRRWLVVVNRRPVPGGLQPVADEKIVLQPLGEEAAHQLIDSATAAAPLKPHENDVIVTRSGGSPLFLEELVRVARSSGTESLPESLDAVANTSIDTLAPLHRQVLRYAAVLGHSFEQQLLSEVLAHEGLEFDPRRDVSSATTWWALEAVDGAFATRSRARPPTKGFPSSGAGSCTLLWVESSSSAPTRDQRPTPTPCLCIFLAPRTGTRPGVMPDWLASRQSRCSPPARLPSTSNAPSKQLVISPALRRLRSHRFGASSGTHACGSATTVRQTTLTGRPRR